MKIIILGAGQVGSNLASAENDDLHAVRPQPRGAAAIFISLA